MAELASDPEHAGDSAQSKYATMADTVAAQRVARDAPDPTYAGPADPTGLSPEELAALYRAQNPTDTGIVDYYEKQTQRKIGGALPTAAPAPDYSDVQQQDESVEERDPMVDTGNGHMMRASKYVRMMGKWYSDQLHNKDLTVETQRRVAEMNKRNHLLNMATTGLFTVAGKALGLALPGASGAIDAGMGQLASMAGVDDNQHVADYAMKYAPQHAAHMAATNSGAGDGGEAAPAEAAPDPYVDPSAMPAYPPSAASAWGGAFASEFPHLYA